MTAVFHGTELQACELLDAVNRNCACERQGGLPDGRCASHQMMLDQRVLDGLLCARHRLSQLLDSEFNPQAEFGAFDAKGEVL